MKKLLLLLVALALPAQTVTLSDTLTTAVGGAAYTGRITVTLNAPALAQPLYYSTTSLTGWQAVYCLGVTGSDCTTTTSAGVFAATLYANSTITPAGTSYSARFTPSKGSPWSEVWVVGASDTKLYQVRSTAVPTPTTMFSVGQLTGGSATNGNCLVFDGSAWAPAACASGGGSGTVTSVAATVPSIMSISGSPITTSGTLAISLVTQTANQVFAGPTTGSAATPAFRSLVSADIPANAANTSGNAGTATALAANGTNCSAGSYPLGVDASGNAEGCTVASGGGGTVTSVSVTTANGVSGSVATATTTPAITLTLGTITPTSVAASGNVTGANLSGTNTGDQTTITGNAGTATALAANGANCSAGSFPLGVDASGASETCTALPTTIAGTANQITASAATGAITLSIPTNPTLPGTTTGTFSGNLTGNVTGNVSGSSGSTTGNAATATALAANGTNCSAGSFPLGVDASGASETCTALPTTISGTSNEISASASTGAVTLSLPSTVDLTSKIFRVPNSTTLPGTCSVGDSYMDTDATSGARWYLCESTNTWAVQGGGGGGSGTVTSVAQSFTGGLISVAGSPITTSGTLALTVAGTSGGIPYFSSASAWASSSAGTAGALMSWGGAATAPAELTNSTQPNSGELRLATTPNASATRAVVTLGPTAWSGGSANGTILGLNAASGFTGHLLRGATNSSTMFSVDGVGDVRGISFQAVNSGFSLLSSGLNHLNNGTVTYANTSTGSSAVMRITGNGGTASTNFLVIRGSSGGTPTDQLRINADSKAIMVGQTVNTTSLSSMSLYVGDTTATTGVTRMSLQAGAGQSTTPVFEIRATNATANSGTLGLSILDTGRIVTSSANEATGSATPTLGTNAPYVGNDYPYTWIKFTTSDGSTVFVPAWK